MSDHDLLIELRTEMRGVRGDVKDIKDGLGPKVEMLEATKLDKAEAERTFQDIEMRLRSVERRGTQTATWGSVALVAISILQGVAVFFVRS